MAHEVRDQNGASKSVYRLRLNVGLFGNRRWVTAWEAFSPGARMSERAAREALAWAASDVRTLLADFGPIGGFRIRSDSAIFVAHCDGTEPTIYVETDLDAGRDLDTVAACIAHAADALAVLTTQDAIAWALTAVQSQSATLENETRNGVDGPAAEAWRPFNPAYFVTVAIPVDVDPLRWAHG